MRQVTRFAATALASIGLLLAGSANSALITVQLTGNVTSVDARLGTQFSTGDALSLTYSYSSEAIDQSSFPSSGEYLFNSFSGTVGSYSFSSNTGYYTLYNDSSLGDQIWVYGGSGINGADVAGAVLDNSSTMFRDFDKTFLSDDSLITVAPDLAEMEAIVSILGFDFPSVPGISPRAVVLSSITSAVATSSDEPGPSVPIPAPLALWGLGMVGLAITRRRRQCP